MPCARLAAAILCIAALAPRRAAAATVEVHETLGDTNEAALLFRAAPTEADRLTASVNAEPADHYEIRLSDGGAPITAGAGCSGGAAMGVSVSCQVHKSAPAENEICGHVCTRYIPGTAWELKMSFALGNGGSSLDASTLPASIPIEVSPGEGNDTVLTAGGDDVINPSAGDDTIRTGAGTDHYLAAPAPDGADHVDLGDGYDFSDYSGRTTSIRFSDDEMPDDGAPGEGDELVGVEDFSSGSGEDLLELHHLAPKGTFARLSGGPGNDLLRGGEGRDALYGGLGDDSLFGEGSRDSLTDGAYGSPGGGDDLAQGGDGDDLIAVGEGSDRALGEGGADRIYLGEGDDLGHGGSEGDLIEGEEGGDSIRAGDGADRLVGGQGIDRLIAGRGADLVLAGSIPNPIWSMGFLRSPGPIENRRDRLDCGPGLDRAAIDRRDSLLRCEDEVPLSQLEVLFGPIASVYHGRPAARVQYEVRSPGTVSVSGPGLMTLSHPDNAKYHEEPRRLPVVPVGATLRRLESEGSVSVQARITLHRENGGSITRVRSVRIFDSGQ